MFIPELVCVILATIGAEILLLIVYDGESTKELLKQSFELWCKKRWLKAIDKEIGRYNHLYQKTKRQHHILSAMINRYNEIYGGNLTLGGKKK